MLFLSPFISLPPHSPVDATLSLLPSVCCTDLPRFLDRLYRHSAGDRDTWKAAMSPPDAGTTFCVNQLKQPSESDTQTVYQSVSVLDPLTETVLMSPALLTHPDLFASLSGFEHQRSFAVLVIWASVCWPVLCPVVHIEGVLSQTPWRAEEKQMAHWTTRTWLTCSSI